MVGRSRRSGQRGGRAAATRSSRRPGPRRARLGARWRFLREAVIWAKALPALHTNGCGDFTLMSRGAWLELRGYPELHMFSMFIDSLLVYTAHWHGLKEEFLPHPIYHIEH